MSDSAFKVHAMELGPMENFVYLIEDIASRRCAVVDPAWEVDQIVARANQHDLNITDILLTHSHHDHINGIEGLLNHANAEVHLLKPEYEFWQHELDKPSLHHGGDELELGATTIKILHTPGHTPGGMSLCAEERGVLFSGDTLFAESVGRTDFPGGSQAILIQSIRDKLFVLPDQTRVYPGHGPSTTIGHEKLHNPYAS